MNSHKLCFPGRGGGWGAETGDEDVLRNRGAEEPVELAGAEHVRASLVWPMGCLTCLPAGWLSPCLATSHPSHWIVKSANFPYENCPCPRTRLIVSAF